MYLKLNVIASSSSGNCTFIWDSSSLLLVDCGLSRKYTKDALKKLQLKDKNIEGILLTHSHGDHLNEASLRYLVNKGTKVYATKEILTSLLGRYKSVREAKNKNAVKVIDGESFNIGNFTVASFPVPHDIHCIGYNIFKKLNGSLKKATIATDLSSPEKYLTKHFKDSDIIVLESNYDEDMLNDSTRPAWLKNRISSGGHLSNRECKIFIDRIMSESERRPSSIVLAHISNICNSESKALQNFKGYKSDLIITAASKKNLGRTVVIK